MLLCIFWCMLTMWLSLDHILMKFLDFYISWELIFLWKTSMVFIIFLEFNVAVPHLASCCLNESTLLTYWERPTWVIVSPLVVPCLLPPIYLRFDSTSMDDLTLYRSVASSLQYLLVTQPYLSFAVNGVCQFMHAPFLTHWRAVKQILHYL